MERKQVQLLSFIHQNKKEGSILFVSIDVLLIISSVLLFHYRYYQNYQEMGRDLCSIYIDKIRDNLRGQ